MKIPDCIINIYGFIECKMCHDNLFLIKEYDWYEEKQVERIYILGGNNEYIIGSAQINIDTKEISDFSIYEKYRDKGYGTILINFAINSFGINNLVVLEDNKRAIKFYSNKGFYIDKIDDNIIYMKLKKE